MKAQKPVSRFDIPTPFSLCGLPEHTGVLLAYSGGADSSALLHLLSKQAKEHGFSLTLLHFHHGIRAKEADRDEAFCRATAEQYGLPILVGHADIPALAKEHKTGIEEEARRQRYAFFEAAMAESGAGILVTAHHADDNLETVLFRLARGTSLSGLGGIAPVRTFGNGYLVRPLLALSKEDLLAYCQEQGVAYVEDSSNAELSYTRNFIRTNLVPGLKKLFDHPEKRFSRTAEWLREDEDYLSALAENVPADLTKNSLPMEALTDLPKPLLRRLIGRFAEAHTGKSPSGIQIASLLELIENRAGRTELSNGFWVAVEGKTLRIYPADETEPIELPPFGVGKWLAGGMTILVEEGKTLDRPQKNSCVLSLQSGQTLIWRVKTPGETILLGGHHKKLRKCYREVAISPYFRERLPLLCDENGVVFAPYVGTRDGVAKTEENLYTVRVFLPDDKT